MPTGSGLIRSFPDLPCRLQLSGFSLGNRTPGKDPLEYDRVILCGPIYTGSLAAPCRNFIGKYGKKVKKLDFITCCGSSDEKKNETMGYGILFDRLREQIGDQVRNVYGLSD